jgi:hypothetical protein
MGWMLGEAQGYIDVIEQENLRYVGLKVTQDEKDRLYRSQKPLVFISAVVRTSCLTEYLYLWILGKCSVGLMCGE